MGQQPEQCRGASDAGRVQGGAKQCRTGAQGMRCEEKPAVKSLPRCGSMFNRKTLNRSNWQSENVEPERFCGFDWLRQR
jgi:hypothetical protein